MNQIEAAAQTAAEWWGARLERGDRAKFVETLRDLIRKDLEECGHCELSCDYDPEGHLLAAVRACGVECSGVFFSAQGILPQKHFTRIETDLIEPKEGYGNWTDPIPIVTETP